jgi:hypothetical protein
MACFFTYCHREGAALCSLPPHTSEPLSPQGLFFLFLSMQMENHMREEMRDKFSSFFWPKVGKVNMIFTHLREN